MTESGTAWEPTKRLPLQQYGSRSTVKDSTTVLYTYGVQYWCRYVPYVVVYCFAAQSPLFLNFAYCSFRFLPFLLTVSACPLPFGNTITQWQKATRQPSIVIVECELALCEERKEGRSIVFRTEQRNEKREVYQNASD